MLHFNDGLYKEGIEYFLITDRFDFDSLWNIIQDVIKPTSTGDYEITSWTEAISFKKDGLEFYFEEVYIEEPSVFTLRLLPFGKHIKDEEEKLKQMVELIDQNI